MTAPLDSLAQRYGTGRPRGRGLVIAVTTVIGAAFLVWVAWAAWFHSNPGIDATIVSYKVVGTHEVQVRLGVHFARPDTDGSCLVRAIAVDHTVVGEVNLTAAELRAAGASWIPIRTERQATTAEVVRCSDSS